MSFFTFQVPVKKPLFVIGFPRTGTTFLHEMLGLHPLLRMHYLWEQYEHVPTTSSEDCIELLKDRRERYVSLLLSITLFLL